VKLVDVLPEPKDLREDEWASAKAVAMTGGDEGPIVEVEGHRLDPTRVFVLDTAAEVKDVLDAADVPAAIVPLEDIEFPDQRNRFEVRVREADLERANRALAAAWQEHIDREGTGGADQSDVEKCPACGAHVPLDVEECPDCGLVIGAGEERSA
jgi:hypothetical protein